MNDVIEWLSNYEPDFGELSKSEIATIQNFTLLWSFFESTCLNSRAGMPQIRNFVQKLDSVDLTSLKVEELKNYFIGRYMENGESSYRYHHLHLDRSNNPKEVEDLLNDREQSEHDKVIGCLGIIYRYRNNLFHGEKWSYKIREQEENFKRSNEFLMELMSLSNKDG